MDPGKMKTYRFACAFCGRIVTMEARNQKEAFKRIRSILFRWKKMWIKTGPTMVAQGCKKPLTDDDYGWVCPGCVDDNYLRGGYYRGYWSRRANRRGESRVVRNEHDVR